MPKVSIPSGDSLDEILVDLDDSLVMKRRIIKRLHTLVMPGGTISESILTDFGQTQAFVRAVLGPIWITSCLYAQRATASLGPDYNGPAGEQLFAEWPEDICGNGFDAEVIVDLEQGRAKPEDRCAALLKAMVKALIIKAGLPKVEAAAENPDTKPHHERLKELYESVLTPLPDTMTVSREIYDFLKPEIPFEGDYILDLAAGERLVRSVLPGFWILSGLCYLSGDASIGPDYDGPDGERLRQEWPETLNAGRWDEDLRHEEYDAGVPEQGTALLRCLLNALMDREPYLAVPPQPTV